MSDQQVSKTEEFTPVIQGVGGDYGGDYRLPVQRNWFLEFEKNGSVFSLL